jgi:hypothetical protein
MKLIAISVLAITLSACTWVELTSQGRGVAIRQQTNSVDGCQRIGTVNARTRASIIAGTSRDHKTIAEELSRLARNEAAKMNANTIVAKNDVDNGQQSFITYNCQ